MSVFDTDMTRYAARFLELRKYRRRFGHAMPEIRFAWTCNRCGAELQKIEGRERLECPTHGTDQHGVSYPFTPLEKHARRPQENRR